MPENEPAIDEIRAATERAGLDLTDEELQKLQRSAVRMRRWGDAIRGDLEPEVEPATTFAAGQH